MRGEGGSCFWLVHVHVRVRRLCVVFVCPSLSLGGVGVGVWVGVRVCLCAHARARVRLVSSEREGFVTRRGWAPRRPSGAAARASCTCAASTWAVFSCLETDDDSKQSRKRFCRNLFCTALGLVSPAIHLPADSERQKITLT